jgi:phage tail protein X
MPSGQKAYLETESGDRIDCLFNPAEFSISQSNGWEGSNAPGRNAPQLEFTGGQSGTMGLDLIFDTTADGTPVTKHTNKLLDVMRIDERLPGHDASRTNGRPQWVIFHWGDLHSFKAVVESLNLSFTYFSASATPLRAKATLSLKQWQDEGNWRPQNPTSGTPAPHRVHQVQVGDTLDRLAARYYGNSSAWRVIAEANGVVDPLRLKPGALLAIPKAQGAVRHA